MSKNGQYYQALVKAEGRKQADILLARAEYNVYNFSMDDSRQIKKWRPRNHSKKFYVWGDSKKLIKH